MENNSPESVVENNVSSSLDETEISKEASGSNLNAADPDSESETSVFEERTENVPEQTQPESSLPESNLVDLPGNIEIPDLPDLPEDYTFDPAGFADTNRIDAIFQETSAALNKMSRTALDDLVSTRTRLDSATTAPDTADKLDALQKQIKEQQELLQNGFSLLDDQKLESLESLNVSGLNDLSARAAEILQADPQQTASSLSDRKTMSETSSGGNLDDILASLAAFSATLNETENSKSAAVSTENGQPDVSKTDSSSTETSVSDSTRPDSSAAESFDFMGTIRGILDDAAHKAKEIDEEFKK